MKDIRVHTAAALLYLLCVIGAHAQQTQANISAPRAATLDHTGNDTGTAANTGAVSKTGAIPNVIRFGGSFHPANGMPSAPVESVTLSVYSDQTGGNALWQETQNVAVDGEGKYSVLMGATQNDGVPLDLLSAGEPRWLGAQFNRPGEAEQPRVLLASVPYALKSVDAETLGGKPASAYLLASPGTTASNNLASNAVSTTASGTTAPATSTTVMTNTAVKPRATNGTAGFIGVFTDASDIGNSVMQQSGGFIGVGTVPGAGAGTTPSLDLRTQPFSQIGMAQTVDYLTFFSSDTYGPAIYWNPGKDMRFGKGGTPLYNAFGFTEQMRIQSSTGNLGIGTTNPGSKLDVAGNINTSGSFLVQGSPVLQVSTAGNNIGLGVQALLNNSSGNFNTATGYEALYSNTTGSYNTADGFQALIDNAIGGINNTATGYRALAFNSSGANNTADGFQALANNSTTGNNTAVGYEALEGGLPASANVGTNNTAVGAYAMLSNTTGRYDAAIGAAALQANTAGQANTAAGFGALTNNTQGSNNIAIGYMAAATVSPNNGFNIHIGNMGASGDIGTIKIGTFGTQTQFFAAGANANLGGDGNAVGVLIDTATGQLGVASSSRRYKEDIEDMGEASHGLMRLRPVTFRYKKPFADGTKPVQYGLIAEEVDEVYPDLVAHSADGQIETVKYQVLDSMLLNEVQRQQTEIGTQKEQLRRLEQQNVGLLERIEKLEAAMGSASRVSGVAVVR